MGLVSSNWFDTLDMLHVQILMLTDVQTPFLGTPLVPLKDFACLQRTPALAARERQPESLVSLKNTENTQTIDKHISSTNKAS